MIDKRAKMQIVKTTKATDKFLTGFTSDTVKYLILSGLFSTVCPTEIFLCN